GLSASFWLEAGVNNDNGSGATTSTNNQSTGSTGGGGLTFNRRSTVSLNGGFGEIRLGRDYTPHFWNLTTFDAFGTNGVGTAQTLNSSLDGYTSVRASNAIGYFLPGNLGGFYGQVQYYMGENASTAANKKDGTGLSARVGYANGPINVGLAVGQTKYLAGDITTWNVGASYDLGVAKILSHYSENEVDGGGATGKSFLIGGQVPVGAGVIRLAYSIAKIDTTGSDPRTDKIALGYVHNLSKRTAVYATFAHLKNKNGATQALNGAVTTGNSNGYDLGIKHSF
ncbi:MAG: porin, partial [Acidovorax sp.]|uniref:porin n=1 Tax=Acidovorax sp. TaxID=1872122 RepID=UPI0039E292AC